MPSLTLSESDATPKDTKDKKNKKTKNQSLTETEPEGSIIGKRSSKLGTNPNPPEFDEDGVSGKKSKKKKRKASDLEVMTTANGDEERSETSSELVEPESSKQEKKMKKKMKKAKLEEPVLMEEFEKKEDPNAVFKFRISEPLRAKLKEKGIESLFPIQAMTFDTILSGSDLVGRARTGQGKTLALVLPISESLTNGPTKASRRTGYGRPPSILVLLPTRELACQVHADFEVYGGVMELTSCCLYGGAPYQGQEIKLKRGVDIVVGTPGRIKEKVEMDYEKNASLSRSQRPI